MSRQNPKKIASHMEKKSIYRATTIAILPTKSQKTESRKRGCDFPPDKSKKLCEELEDIFSKIWTKTFARVTHVPNFSQNLSKKAEFFRFRLRMAEEKPNPIATTRPTNFMTTTRPTSYRSSQGPSAPRVPRELNSVGEPGEDGDCMIDSILFIVAL